MGGNTTTCDHSLSILGTMETKEVNHDYIRRVCTICTYQEVLRRSGKLRRGYSIQAESKREFERRDFAKDLLQPQQYNRDRKKFETSEIFQEAWGNPEKQAEVGTKVEDFRIKE